MTTVTPQRRPSRARIVLAAALGLFACATYSEKTQLARDAAQAGDLAGSEKVLNKFLKVRRSSELPSEWKKETVVALLERAMVLRGKGEWKQSARDLGVADKQLVLLDIARDAGQVGKWIFSDSAGKYHAPPSEKLALNAFNMLNYLLADDLSGARVEAKRFTITREYLGQQDQNAHGAFGSYIAGFVYERLGEADTALRYYDEALQEQAFPSLRAPVARLAARSSYRSPRIRALLGEAEPSASATRKATTLLAQTPADPPPTTTQPEPARAEPGELLVVMNVGRVPYKVPERMPIGLAIGLGATWITGNTAILERSALKFVIYPELVPSRALFNTGNLSIDGHEHPLELATNLDAEIVREYEALKPKIIGAAITRLIVRAAVAEGARAAGNQAKDGAGAIVGLLAALAAEGALVAADKPDTRSWTLLPAFVFVARVPVAPGTHQVRVTAMGSGAHETHDFSVDVKPGGFAVVDVTTLR
jgi:tetratricopeptide (TPR) repeat protein